MKRFTWRLQRVLEIKTKEVEQKRKELLEITEKLAQSRAELITQRRILEDIISEICGEKPKQRLGKQEFFMRHSAASDDYIKVLEKIVSQMELKQRDKIAEVLKVKRFKEGLEKLRTEAKKRFIKEQEKLEQKELDESTTNSFARNIISHNV